MRHKGPAGIDFGKLGSDLATDAFDNLIFVQEVDLAFRRVNVDIDSLRVNIETQVDRRMAALWQKGRVSLFDGLFDS